ncbi:hypothetical protein L1887_01323 [Cichorium endivia]|nr:hypothetical protein L1887_01323 [Cichorium endivia]
MQKHRSPSPVDYRHLTLHQSSQGSYRDYYPVVPVEVIDNILSCLGAVRHVVIASTTCKKWREACHRHLYMLSFNFDDWPVFGDLTTSRLEILITQTIFQTKGLQCLSILMDDVDEFFSFCSHRMANGESPFENVRVLDIGWMILDENFVDWVACMLRRCGRPKKLIIHGVVSESKTHVECHMSMSFTSSIVQLMRKYSHVDVQFVYE